MKSTSFLCVSLLLCCFSSASLAVVPDCPRGEPAVCMTDAAIAPSCLQPGPGNVVSAQKPSCPAGQKPLCAKREGLTVAVCQGPKAPSASDPEAKVPMSH